MGKLIKIILICAIASGCTKVESHTKEQVNIYATETDAAYADALNRPKVAPLTSLSQGEIVTVLSDTYGKDYWACHIRTQTGKEGWVLCTSLDYRGG
ncbi:SH3 domain-containing protein [Thiobacillus sp.]|uniref:SH3 domain-containing protein n=1 Tax=Thiobacillus sp. TaxID=924 RepID=UPI0025E4A55D|nr:SH3 domain-containing protein [Thiobacillus sp.]